MKRFGVNKKAKQFMHSVVFLLAGERGLQTLLDF